MKKATSKDDTVIAFDQSGRGPGLILVGGRSNNGGRRLFEVLPSRIE